MRTPSFLSAALLLVALVPAACGDSPPPPSVPVFPDSGTPTDVGDDTLPDVVPPSDPPGPEVTPDTDAAPPPLPDVPVDVAPADVEPDLPAPPDVGAADSPDAGENPPPGFRQACGGTVLLSWDGREAAPGESCGPAGTGVLRCAGGDALFCFGAAPDDLCTAGSPGARQLDQPCGACGGGRWSCTDDGEPFCGGALAPDPVCGGCAPPEGLPGEACDGCRIRACDGNGALVCFTTHDNPTCLALPTCADLGCVVQGRVCGGAFADECGGCRPGLVADGAGCRPVTSCRDLDCSARNRVCVGAGPTGDARCGDCPAGSVADSGGACQPIPAVPAGVSATRGTRGDGVLVSWTAVAGVSGWMVLRDGVMVTPVPVASPPWLDERAPSGPPPPAPPGLTATSDRLDGVLLAWEDAVAEPGPEAVWQVVAVQPWAQSLPSEGVQGFRGAGEVTFEVDGPEGWQPIGRTWSWLVADAPAGRVEVSGEPGVTGTREGVVLTGPAGVEVIPPGTSPWRVRATTAAAGAGPAAQADGRRGVGGSVERRWHWAPTADGPWQLVVVAPSAAPVVDEAVAPGETRWYRLEVVVAGTEGWVSVPQSATRPLPTGSPCSVDAQCESPEACRPAGVQTRCLPVALADTASPLTLAWLPSAMHRLGLDENALGWGPGEEQARVALPHDLLVQTTEVTMDQWRRVAGPGVPAGGWPWSFDACGGACPVQRVTWWSAVWFADVLNAREGLPPCYDLDPGTCAGSGAAGTLTCTDAAIRGAADASCVGYRLPSEAEWEALARGGSDEATHNGELIRSSAACGDSFGILNPIARWCGNAAVTWDGCENLQGIGGPACAGPAPAGSRSANALGVFDAVGNVAEWVGTAPSATWEGVVSPGTRPAGPERAVRGGAWNEAAAGQRVTRRRQVAATTRSADLGFRLVRTAPALPGAPAACPALPPLASGSLVIEGSGRGAVARAGCDADRSLRGDAVRVCLASGAWSGVPARCELPWGSPCVDDAACGAGSWCPPDAVERRCAPVALPEAPMPFVVVSAGTATLGSPPSELGRGSGEGQREVTLTQRLLVARTEVQDAQWLAITGGQAASQNTACGGDCPVERVSWWSALWFANELSRREGLQPCYLLPDLACNGLPAFGALDCGATMPELTRSALLTPYGCTGYRLPTDAEWEWLARAGSTSATPDGDLVGTPSVCSATVQQPALANLAWYCENSGGGKRRSGLQSANDWGLVDTLGNVAEWVWDLYSASPPGGENPVLSFGTGFRGVRGGRWSDAAAQVRSAARLDLPHSLRNGGTGFRLVRSLPE